jgi:hypothetical protein
MSPRNVPLTREATLGYFVIIRLIAALGVWQPTSL